MSSAENITLKGWNAVIETNLTGTFNVIQQCYNKSVIYKNHPLNIVNITLLIDSRPFMPHSVAARAGVEYLTKMLAIEWANNGVKINCVAPGTILSSGIFS